MTGAQTPLLLVDVDGVLSLYGAARAEPGTLVGCLVDGIPHLLSRRAAAVLGGLIEDFECAWCTGWEERADEHLPGAARACPAGWPFVRFVRHAGARRPLEAGGHLRRSPARTVPLAWIDDAHDADCAAWAAARPGPTLLVTTEPDVGLTAAQGAALARWAGAIRSGSSG